MWWQHYSAALDIQADHAAFRDCTFRSHCVFQNPFSSHCAFQGLTGVQVELWVGVVTALWGYTRHTSRSAFRDCTFSSHCVFQGPTGVRKLPEPKHLQFHLDTPLMHSLQDAKNQFAELVCCCCWGWLSVVPWIMTERRHVGPACCWSCSQEIIEQLEIKRGQRMLCQILWQHWGGRKSSLRCKLCN